MTVNHCVCENVGNFTSKLWKSPVRGCSAGYRPSLNPSPSSSFTSHMVEASSCGGLIYIRILSEGWQIPVWSSGGAVEDFTGALRIFTYLQNICTSSQQHIVLLYCSCVVHTSKLRYYHIGFVALKLKIYWIEAGGKWQV